MITLIPRSLCSPIRQLEQLPQPVHHWVQPVLPAGPDAMDGGSQRSCQHGAGGAGRGAAGAALHEHTGGGRVWLLAG